MLIGFCAVSVFARDMVDRRPGAKCYHNEDLYFTVPRYLGDVCPAPRINYDFSGNHIEESGDKHTPEDCIITVVPGPGSK